MINLRLITLLCVLSSQSTLHNSFAASAAAGALSRGSNSQSSKIATLDLRQILDNSLALTDLKNQIQNARQKLEKEIEDQKATLSQKHKNLYKKADNKQLPEVVDFENEVQNLKQSFQAKKVQLERAYSAAVSKVQKLIMEIVSEVCKIQGYKVILPSSQVIYATPELDITANVLSKLNERMDTVELKLD